MMKSKKTRRRKCLNILVWVTASLLCLTSVLALGIRPAKMSLAIEEGRDYTGQFWVVNNEGREFSVTISVGGEMGPYVTVHTTELNFRSDDGAKAVDFEVHLPEQVPPGESKAIITIEENLAAAAPNVISSKIVLKYDVLVQGPYPDKYVLPKLNFYESGDEIRMVSEVENRGKKDIDTIQTVFYVNDKHQQVQALETLSTNLASKETKLLDARITRSAFELGEFSVSAVTTYDDQKVELLKKLIVGQPEVDITYFDKYFIAYTINQYSLELLNRWNQQLENVFVEVEVKKEGQAIDQFRTKSVDLEGNMAKRINDYFNAKDKGPGTYTFEMAVNFWNLVRDEQKKFTFESELVDDEGALQDAVALAGKASRQQAGASAETAASSGASFSAILVWLLAGIAAGAAGFFVAWRYFHRREYEGGDGAL